MYTQFIVYILYIRASVNKCFVKNKLFFEWVNYDVENEDRPRKQNPCQYIEFNFVFDNKTPDEFDATVAITRYLDLMDQRNVLVEIEFSVQHGENQHLLEMTGACDLFIALLLNDSPVPEDMRKSVSQCALYS